jgi:3-phosphoglycerate kinase
MEEPQMPNLTLDLNVFDDDGAITGKTRRIKLSVDAIQDIIDHATSLAIRYRNEADEMELRFGLAELSEALETHDVITDPASTSCP